jgi:hypothetical protein
MSDITQLLSAIDASDPKAADQLLPLVYEELRKLAAVRIANEKPGQTLQPTDRSWCLGGAACTGWAFTPSRFFAAQPVS